MQIFDIFCWSSIFEFFKYFFTFQVMRIRPFHCIPILFDTKLSIYCVKTFIKIVRQSRNRDLISGPWFIPRHFQDQGRSFISETATMHAIELRLYRYSTFGQCVPIWQMGGLRRLLLNGFSTTTKNYDRFNSKQQSVR